MQCGCCTQERLYRVQTGAFRNREYAQEMLEKLLSEGFPSFLLLEDRLYKVQVGAYRMLDNAVRMEKSLRDAGYATFITT
ncbi:MAG: SPOR domain-containing protein [Lachnospiraceae bacterium]